MLLTFAKVLRYLWPFLKESILQGGTVGTWLLRNIITCVWIFLLLTMLGVVLYMGDVAHQLQGHLATMAQQKGYAIQENEKLKLKVTSLRAKLAAERGTTAGLRLTDETHVAWLQRCGLPLDPSATTPCPSRTRIAPPKRPPVDNRKHGKPKPKPQPQTPAPSGFKERLKKILGIGSNSSEAK